MRRKYVELTGFSQLWLDVLSPYQLLKHAARSGLSHSYPFREVPPCTFAKDQPINLTFQDRNNGGIYGYHNLPQLHHRAPTATRTAPNVIPAFHSNALTVRLNNASCNLTILSGWLILGKVSSDGTGLLKNRQSSSYPSPNLNSRIFSLGTTDRMWA